MQQVKMKILWTIFTKEAKWTIFVKHWPAMQHLASKTGSRPAVKQNRKQQLA